MEYFDLTELLIFGIGVLMAIITRYVVPWLKNRVVQIGNEDLDFWLDYFVRAAEEQYKKISGSGGLKFAYVKDKLLAQGFTYDDDIISALIDGKVRELFNWDDYDVKVGGTE